LENHGQWCISSSAVGPTMVISSYFLPLLALIIFYI
jgi:hypothetical protein